MGTARGFLVLLVVAASFSEILALEAELEQIEPNELLSEFLLEAFHSGLRNPL